MRKLTLHQQEVMDVLRQGAHLYLASGHYELSGRIGCAPLVLASTFNALRGRGLIKLVEHPHRHDSKRWILGMPEQVWVATDPQEASKCQSD